ncbi:MAG: ABC transporter ATP-binding protein [Myxococcota bacterium]
MSKDYGPVHALRDVSLSVESGALVWLAGANGAGKSTLLRVLGSLTRPTRGSVSLFGVDPFRSAGAPVRARVGFLGQDAALYGELSIAENLRFCARLRGVAEAELHRIASELELGPVLEQRVRTLSQGYRRRAGLARALLGSPSLLLLDEPWNGLDADSGERLTRLLARLRDAGAVVLVAAHEASGPLPRFDRRLRLDGGRLTADGVAA